MMSKLWLIVLAVSVFLSSCQKNDSSKILDLGESELQITSGFVCGWCAGADSLVVVKDAFFYRDFNPCTNEEVNLPVTGELTTNQWNDLVQLLDYDDFSSIDLSSCNVCADGCDNWVRIRQGNEQHAISYGNSAEDSISLQPILPFLEKLAELKKMLINQ